MKAMIAILTAAFCGGIACVAVAEDGCCTTDGIACANKTCYPEATVKKEKKTCFEIECKEICIPAVRLPWQSCCKPRCGRVRIVKILKKVDYEVEKCDYKWHTFCNANSRGSGGCGNCGGRAESTSPAPVPPVPSQR